MVRISVASNVGRAVIELSRVISLPDFFWLDVSKFCRVKNAPDLLQEGGMPGTKFTSETLNENLSVHLALERIDRGWVDSEVRSDSGKLIFVNLRGSAVVDEDVHERLDSHSLPGAECFLESSRHLL